MQTPRRLYKYQAFNVNALRLLDRAEVYYADPSTFNDPLDCNLSIKVDADVNSLENLLFNLIAKARGKNDANKAIRRRRYESTEIGDYKKNQNAADHYTRSLANDIERILREELGQRGVLSLAVKWNCPLMWSHYGDEHRGFCVEYDTTETAPNTFKSVSYSSPRTLYVSDLIDWKIKGNEQVVKKIEETIFFSKASQWRYEREWRSIVSSPGSVSATAKVSAIIFGLRCDDTVINTVVRLFAQSEVEPKFYKINLKDDSFRLYRRLIDHSDIERSSIRHPSHLLCQGIMD